MHLLRNLCSKVRSADRQEIAGDFMAIAKAKGGSEAATLLGGFNAKWGPRYPKVRQWASGLDGILTFMDFPEDVRHLIYTNNPIESLDKQIKRGLKKQTQFVAEEALEKRLVTMFLHFNDCLKAKKVRGWRTIVDLISKQDILMATENRICTDLKKLQIFSSTSSNIKILALLKCRLFFFYFRM